MDHTISMQPANMMGPLTQQMNHLSLGTTGTYMTAAAAPMQGTYIPQYTAVPASAVSVEGVVTEASPQSVPPSSQDASGQQQPLGVDNTSDHAPTYTFQPAKIYVNRSVERQKTTIADSHECDLPSRGRPRAAEPSIISRLPG
ncbi:RNA-binding single-stranded-interacting 3 isoform X3 [Labeo rohita]|uniref:RNA-binding single-stranded-interacting 3 isoform X3 n=1 Tax=Labeo rohita TaxID=84645 RepID=A0A498LJV9_LABRO|nr:RNA-binding single-stranded-interacting 3 isoform X3 [Labeo rohita]